jgi:hypothetical protein
VSRYVYVRADTLEPSERFLFTEPHSNDDPGVEVTKITANDRTVMINDTLVLPADSLVALVVKEAHEDHGTGR